MLLYVTVSVGELFDKITILQIKTEHLSDEEKLANVNRELGILQGVAESVEISNELSGLIINLRSVSEALWDIENRKRNHERAGRFDGDFIELARAVYIVNDRRASIKREINIATRSLLIEKKQHGP